MSVFDNEELAIAATHGALAGLLQSLDIAFRSLNLDASTLEQAHGYVLSVDPTAHDIAEVIRSATGKGFLYHAHEHVERCARHASGILSAAVHLSAPAALSADREARLVEAKLESLLCDWVLDTYVPFQDFLWTLCITGDPHTFGSVDAAKSKAVGTALGIPEPKNIDRPQIKRIRASIWTWNLHTLFSAGVPELAYARWRVRRSAHGDDWDDWFAAEAAHRLLAAPASAEGSGNLEPWIF
jgi:hypothetical protein